MMIQNEIRTSNRGLRQKSIIPPDRLENSAAMIVGVGAIGRQVAMQLAATGLSKMLLVDFDEVEEVNLGPQGYYPSDIGTQKVSATGLLCSTILPEIDLRTRAEAVSNEIGHEFANMFGNDCMLAVFCCVDSFRAREQVSEAAKVAGASFFVDGRMSAENVEVYVWTDEEQRKMWQSTVVDDRRAFQDGCTARSTIYSAGIAAGLMIGQFTKKLRKLPVNTKLRLNLMDCEMESD